MPELGGATTQSGVLYQNSITTLYLGRLLDASYRPDSQRVVHVRVEAPYKVDDTIVTFADSHKTYIQAKESLIVGSNEWKKLWANFDEQFRQKEFQRDYDRLLFYVGFGLQEHYDLKELCKRATNSPTTNEWGERLGESHRKIKDKIEPLLQIYGLTDQYIWEFLKHVDVEILPLRAIQEDRLQDWVPHTNRTQFELFSLLRDQVGGKARIKGEFTSSNLRKQLLSISPSLEFISPADIKTLQDSISQCGSLLRQHPSTISGTNIYVEQEVVRKMVAWLLEETVTEKNVALLLDQAGMGKTVVMQDILVKLENSKINVLAIKADQQLSNISVLADIQVAT